MRRRFNRIPSLQQNSDIPDTQSEDVEINEDEPVIISTENKNKTEFIANNLTDERMASMLKKYSLNQIFANAYEILNEIIKEESLQLATPKHHKHKHNLDLDTYLHEIINKQSFDIHSDNEL